MADVTLEGAIAGTSTAAGTLSLDQVLAGAIAGISSVVAILNVPEAPDLIRGIRLVAPGGRHSIRRVPYGWIRRTVAYVEGIEAVAERALTGPVLWAGSTWFRVSIDGGGYIAVGATRATAVSLGAFTEGQRKSLNLELTVPGGAEIRTDLLALNLGIGIDY